MNECDHGPVPGAARRGRRSAASAPPRCLPPAIGDDDGFARTLRGEWTDLERLRATMVADLDGIVAGLALLDTASRRRTDDAVIAGR